jgi:putative hemolysin
MRQDETTERTLTTEASRETATMRAAQALRDESDRSDPYAVHLLVRDGRGGRTLACARLLGAADALEVGGFAAQREFDLTRLLTGPGRLLELGGIRVAPGRRSAAVLAALWSAIAREAAARGAARLMGLVRVPAGAAAARLDAALASFRAPEDGSARPRRGLPGPSAGRAPRAVLPPLLGDYLRLGAELAGPPSWDPETGAASFLAVAAVERLAARASLRFPAPRAAALT